MVDIIRGAERLMGMTEEVWLRHANPWSVWTRVLTTLPLMSVAIWSRVWIGWYSLVPIALSVFWAWLNPRAFPPPRMTDSWSAKGTFGERVFLEQRGVGIPSHHLRAAKILSALSFAGLAVWAYGLWQLDFWATVAGILGVVIPKVWFVDRMVWLYEDMKDTDSRYSGWLHSQRDRTE